MIHALIEELIEAVREVCHAPEDALDEPCARMEAARVAVAEYWRPLPQPPEVEG
jgi:hypothetical protein